jgi:hypothetical protein
MHWPRKSENRVQLSNRALGNLVVRKDKDSLSVRVDEYRRLLTQHHTTYLRRYVGFPYAPIVIVADILAW